MVSKTVIRYIRLVAMLCTYMSTHVASFIVMLKVMHRYQSSYETEGKMHINQKNMDSL